MMSGTLSENRPILPSNFPDEGEDIEASAKRSKHHLGIRPKHAAICHNMIPKADHQRFELDSPHHGGVSPEHIVDIFGAPRITLGSHDTFSLDEVTNCDLIESSDEFFEYIDQPLGNNTPGCGGVEKENFTT